MENTLENAVSYLENKYNYKRDRDKHNDMWLHEMVAYASQVSPKIVLPARKEIDEGNMDKETVYYSHGFNTCHSQIIRLNPHLNETK